MKYAHLPIYFLIFIFAACSKSDDNNDPPPPPPDNTPEPIAFSDAQAVTVSGYEDHVMEPFLSRDGNILFFNNLNDPSVDTNLHWAIRTSTTSFVYQGLVGGIATPDLEGVASLDVNGDFYFIFTGDYDTNLSSIYFGQFSDGNVSNKAVVEGVSRLEAGWLNFDAEISADGNTLYFADGLYDANGGPNEANLVIAKKEGNTWMRADNSAEILQNVNTDGLEYAPGLSANELTMYFTRIVDRNVANPLAQIFITTRNSRNEAFGEPQLISELSGFVEAATVTPDGQGFYYHKLVNNLYQLFYREIL